MIIVDTNVLSEFVRPEPSDRVIKWLDSHPRSDLVITAVTAFEMLYGAAKLPDGQRRGRLGAAVAEQLAAFAGRILPFDAEAAAHAADLTAARRLRGRPIQMPDAQIAGIARSRGCALATRNTRDFAEIGIELIDPWRG